MKRIISLVLMFAMLFGVSAFAEEDFTLHNGTKFGMAIEEVIAIEGNNGFSLSPDETGTSCRGEGTIANQPNSSIYYVFGDNNSLWRMCYGFNSLETFDIVEKGLISKYGNTDFSSDTGLAFPNIYTDPEAPQSSVPLTSYYEANEIIAFDARLLEYSHRLIELDDGQCIFIEHYAWVRDCLVYGEISSVWEWHDLNYRLLTPDEIEIIKNATASNDDL